MITSTNAFRSAMPMMPKPTGAPKAEMPDQPKIQPHAQNPDPKQEMPSPAASGIRFETSA